MKEEEYLKSDDIEIVALYCDILLKKGDLKYVKNLLRDTDYKIVEFFEKLKLIKQYNIHYYFSNGGAYTSYPTEEENGIILNYKIKKKNKKPMFDKFLIDKKNRKYV